MIESNITTTSAGGIHSSFQSFRKLNYWDKLEYYDCHFGLISFLFPEFDIKISWFADEDKLFQLIDNFYKEIRSTNLLETTCEENGKQVTYDIKPTSLIQRSHYNNFLLSKFIKEDKLIRSRIETEMQKNKEAAAFLQAKIHSVHSTISWVKSILQNKKTKSTLKHQFLRLVYSGIKSYGLVNELSHIRIRRKFVEAYLYAQGTYIASHLYWLQHFLEEQEKIT